TCQPSGDSMGAEAVWPALEGPWARRRVRPGPTLFRWVHQAPYIGNARKGVFVKSKLRPKNSAGFLRSALYLPRGLRRRKLIFARFCVDVVSPVLKSGQIGQRIPALNASLPT